MPSVSVTKHGDGPIMKRQKLNSRTEPRRPVVQDSRIFAPFRTVGLVSSADVPFTSVPLGKTTFQITTSVGRCLQTYDLKRGLNLVFVTRPQTPQNVTATLAWKDRVFAAWCEASEGCQPGLWVFKRGKKVEELPIPGDLDQSVEQIVIFGSWIVGRCSTRIEVWRSTTLEHYTTLYIPLSANKSHTYASICTMPTFLNKVFAGRTDGAVDIWNVSTGKLIYTILPPTVDCGAVTAMQPTPALSLTAIAYSKGLLVIHDVRKDRSIILLYSTSIITSISFRTDGLGAGEDGRKPGTMATAGPSSGDVTFWDLNKGGRVTGVLRGAHNPPSSVKALVGGGLNRVEFLPGQPVAITCGLDNSLKSWIFDETPFSPVPRILHSRSGHAAPVTRLQFLPSDSDGADAGGKWLLSAGRDRSLWGWSLRRDGQSTELSQGNIRKKAKKLGVLSTSTLAHEPSTTLEDLKAPEITCIASSLIKDGGMGAFPGNGAIWQKGNHAQRKPTDATKSAITGWESVVTGHRGDKYARTWFWGRKKAGRWALETGDGGNVSSVAISPCGTFAVVGSSLGSIDMFNLQSGLHRQRFPMKLTPAQAKKLKIQQLSGVGDVDLLKASRRFPPGTGKHVKAVTGLAVDSLNEFIISCSLDGKVKYWDFNTGNLMDENYWSPMTEVTGLRYHSPNDLMAFACDDMAVRVVDIETKRINREFWGCKGGINDFCFSNDGRWIIAASQDCIIRVWDLPTGHLIDAIRMSRPCKTLAFSGTGEFFATASEGQIGVDIWSNKTLFKHVPTQHISEDDIAQVTGPTVSGEGGRGLIEGTFEDQQEESSDSISSQSMEQLSSDMMTLSLVPKSKWQTLLHLDLIKQRNKPIEPPKAPEKAPFFLGSALDATKPTSLPSVSVDSSKDTSAIAERSRIMKMDRSAGEGTFTMALKEGTSTGHYNAFIAHLQSLSPSAADLEIRSLSPSTLEGSNELVSFVRALTWRLRQKKDYELVQAWMSVFLRLHSDDIIHDAGTGNKELINALRDWREEMHKEAEKLGDLVGYVGGVIGFLRSPRA